MTERARQRKFRAQTDKLLDLMIHSVYSRRDVFLRELISNASDAIDKARFQALTDRSIDQDQAFQIELLPDAEAGTLSIIDNGIGMSEADVIENLGTIARSGAEAFREAAEEGAELPDGDLIGQFGVGFYSVFMVADKVTVVSQKHGEDHAVKWVSTGGESYMIQRLPVRERGTRVTLQLKTTLPESAEQQTEDSDDAGFGGAEPDLRPPAEAFTDRHRLRSVVKEHSDFIAFPIMMDMPAAQPAAEGEDEPAEPELEPTQLNSMRPLWTRRPIEIEQSEYEQFYQHITHDWQAPYHVVHLHVEGMREYRALLYLPAKAPYDLYTREHRRGLQLYARRVFIMEECRELMPEYLRFVRGLVESPDIPLNLSREMVQQDRLIAAIRKRLTRRVLSDLRDRLSADREGYEAFWTEFGPVLKEGFHYEPNQAQRLQEILLLRSTAVEGWTTLAEYRSRMKEGQQAIYYLSGEEEKRLRDAPQLEAFRSAGVEVLLLADPIDEVVMERIGEFEDSPIRSAGRGDLDLSDIDAKDEAGADDDADAPEASDEAQPEDAALQPLLDSLGAILSEDVETVRVSRRLTDSAVCLVTPDSGLSPQLARMMEAMGQDMPQAKLILEVNPDHALIQALSERVRTAEAAAESDEAEEAEADPRLVEYAEVLLEQARLAEGLPLDKPAEFARRVADLMAKAL